MGSARFDRFVARAGIRSSRRGLLSAAGGGLLAKIGLDAPLRLASAETTCTLAVVATVRLGPDVGQFLWSGATQPGQIHGQLSFGVSPDGHFAGAIFQLDDGTSLSAVGQATGYALQARIALGDERTLILTGVGEQPLAACRGAIGGLLSGPQPGDLGDWQAIANGSGGGTTSSMPPTPIPGPAESGGCSNGMTDCGNGCFDLNNDHDHCGYCDVQCQQVESCIAGACSEAGVGTNDGCPNGTTHCPGAVCVDLSNDSENCGACSMVCGQGQTCWGGVCLVLDGCADGYNDCGGLCVDLANDSLNCGACGIQCHEGTVCSQGVCPPVQVECLAAGENCLVNWDCCSGICNSYDYSYTCADVMD